MGEHGFTFPPSVSREDAQRMLTDAYAAIDAGKLLRRTNKLLRKRGIDPPIDVEYAAEPHVQRFRDGLGIALGADILVHEAFPEMGDCVKAFEDALGSLLLDRLAKKLRKA